MKNQISKLKSLVDFYQDSGMVGAAGKLSAVDDQSSLPAHSDYGGEADNTRNRRLVEFSLYVVCNSSV